MSRKKPNIADDFAKVYKPLKALVIYQSISDSDAYIESFDINPDNGEMLNAHPLNLKECAQIGQIVSEMPQMKYNFLYCNGILPENLLNVSTQLGNPHAIWYTPARKTEMNFSKSLNIPNGTAFVPPMLWKADKENLWVFALESDARPSYKTQLFHAPYFNIYNEGRVCMGTVNVNITEDIGLIDFMAKWEQYFFNSDFSHTIAQTSPISENIVSFWQRHIGSDKKFNTNILTKTAITLKSLFN